MAIRNLLVAYNGTDAADSALALGLLMARKYDAHLTGILAHGQTRASQSLGPWLGADVLSYMAEREHEAVRAIASRFHAQIAKAHRPDKTSFIERKGAPDERLAACAACHDFLLLGSFDPGQGKEIFAAHPDRIALHSGRPLIVVPAGYRTDELPDHVLIAWDGRRSAARALNDAMLILETKSRVTLLTVGRGAGAPEPEGEDPLVHLARHGITAERLRVDAKGRTIGRTILDTCDSLEVGLLVMGAYEHSKFGEDLFGGVTNEVLRRGRIPALMAH